MIIFFMLYLDRYLYQDDLTCYWLNAILLHQCLCQCASLSGRLAFSSLLPVIILWLSFLKPLLRFCSWLNFGSLYSCFILLKCVYSLQRKSKKRQFLNSLFQSHHTIIMHFYKAKILCCFITWSLYEWVVGLVFLYVSCFNHQIYHHTSIWHCSSSLIQICP